MTVRRLQPAWRFSRNELSGESGAVHRGEVFITWVQPRMRRVGVDAECASNRGPTPGPQQGS